METAVLPAEGPLAGVRVMVVDDNSAIRRVVTRLLERQGAELLAAADEDEALAQLEIHRDVDVLLVDLVLGRGQTGESLVRRAQALLPDVRYAYISGHAGETIAGVEDGGVVRRLLRKPFGVEDLVALVKQCLAGDAM